jgi:hypothetical protein
VAELPSFTRLIDVATAGNQYARAMRGAHSSRYQPLAAYPMVQPPGVESLTLPLAQVERITGAPLSRSAFTRRWWRSSTGPAAPALRLVGWVVVDLETRTVPTTVTLERHMTA